MLCDATGFAIPFADDDAIAESACECSDADAGDPAEWPSWCDEDRWEPSQADIEWVNENPSLPEPFEPTDADWEDMAAWSGALTDDDIMAAGLAVG